MCFLVNFSMVEHTYSSLLLKVEVVIFASIKTTKIL